jgi:hypothetical protein
MLHTARKLKTRIGAGWNSAFEHLHLFSARRWTIRCDKLHKSFFGARQARG